MMQNSVSSKKSGIIVAACSLISSFAWAVSPLVFNKIAQFYNATTNPRIYGGVMLLATTIGYVGSSIFYYRGGRAYVKIMEKKK